MANQVMFVARVVNEPKFNGENTTLKLLCSKEIGVQLNLRRTLATKMLLYGQVGSIWAIKGDLISVHSNILVIEGKEIECLTAPKLPTQDINDFIEGYKPTNIIKRGRRK